MIKRKAKRTVDRKPRKVVSRANAAAYDSAGFGKSVPPSPQIVCIYFSQKGHISESEIFFKECENRNWKTAGGTPIRDWKSFASEWLYNWVLNEKLQSKHSLFRHTDP